MLRLNTATHSLRMAEDKDIPDLQHFLHTEWRANHIFVTHPELMRWQHQIQGGSTLSFALARNLQSGVIDGVNGVIQTSRFDPDLQNERDIWLAIWKRRDNLAHSALGMELYDYVLRALQPQSIGILGLTDIAIKMYRMLGFKTGKMAQYYVLNSSMSDYKIARQVTVSERPSCGELCSPGVQIREMSFDQLTQIEAHDARPRKTARYMQTRFAGHPVYRYQCLGIIQGSQLQAALVTRRLQVGQASCVRIVDVYGNLADLPSLRVALEAYLKSHGDEYIDCLNMGIDAAVFAQLGFTQRRDDWIIPNYFEPFEQRNVDIAYAYKSPTRNYVMFKGDGDQDRPNTIQSQILPTAERSQR